MKSLEHQHIVILGLGISGLAMARWCVRFGANVTVVDTRENPPQLKTLNKQLPNIKFIHSNFNSELLDLNELKDIQQLLISPGVKPAEIKALLAAASESNIQIGSELSLFNLALTELINSVQYKPYVLAITGTNGKTTVTSITGKLVECANKTVAVAGNIGPSLLDTLADSLDNSKLPEVWVIELSSFQLNNASYFEPTAGVVLNITEDHLDWHEDMTSYIEAKCHVFGEHACMIINRDDPAVMQLLTKMQAKNKLRKHITFGGDMPSRLGDYGLESVNGITWLVKATGNEEVTTKKQRSLLASANDLHMQRLLPCEGLYIRGQHNMLNALAALALADIAGCSTSKILYGLRNYKGEPHRVEAVGMHNGVEYVDDSKGTNVGATVAAMSGFAAEKKIVVLLGGDGKGQDFSPLESVVSKYARAVVLIGKDKALIAEALKNIDMPKVYCETLALGVTAAAELAQVGDVVLLSPACSSLDMFVNYEHRGNEFKSAVLEMMGSESIEKIIV